MFKKVIILSFLINLFFISKGFKEKDAVKHDKITFLYSLNESNIEFCPISENNEITELTNFFKKNQRTKQNKKFLIDFNFDNLYSKILLDFNKISYSYFNSTKNHKEINFLCRYNI